MSPFDFIPIFLQMKVVIPMHGKLVFYTLRNKCWSYDTNVWVAKSPNKSLQDPNIGFA